MTLQNLTNCGCCEGLSVETPVRIYNRPGLPAITYRVGDHAKFRESLLARLSNSGLPALRNLTTRSDDDFTIALLDAWAVVSDVLTFYQERAANELYLGTATEQFSILELARLIGYELSPGVAASTYLAFTMEQVPGQLLLSPTEKSQAEIPPVTIDAGAKVQSTPGPGEKAQTFETIEAIEARPEWNAIQPRLTQPQLSLADTNIIVLDGAGNDIKAGDIVLITSGLKPRKILNVVIDSTADTTWLYLSAAAVMPTYIEPSFSPNGNIADYPNKVALSASVITALMAKTWKGEDLSTLAETQGWSDTELADSFATVVEAKSSSKGLISVFKKRASVFGYNALKQITYYDNSSIPKPQSLWNDWDLSDTTKTNNKIYLDTAYEQILPGSYIAVQKSGDTIATATVYSVTDADVRAHTDYSVSAKSSALTISPSQQWWETSYTNLAAIRSISILAQSSPLTLAGSPIEDIVSGDTLTLTRYYPGLTTGKAVILTGERHDLEGTSASEIRSIKEIMVAGGLTILVFDEPLDYSYIRDTVAINANVAQATHGETVKEVLGSGDAASTFQKFVLKQPPLTFVSSSSASGIASTLEIRVNNLLWYEVPSFFERAPDDHIYITRQDDEGNTTVIFGDGKNGSRLPTGKENIKAVYRKGIGTGGLLKANQLSQLMTRPLGVKSATNPIKTSGAEDGEVLEDARQNATLTIFTLGRIVSLQDYEDFARAFAGIDKALATWTWTGQKRTIYLTVAGADGATVEGDLSEKLLAAIEEAGMPGVQVTIASFQARSFRVSANILVHPDYLDEIVLPAVEQALRDHFSFDNRGFGQTVAFSEVIAIMQLVDGVVAVDIDELYRSDEAAALNDRLDADIPRPGSEQPFPAELLTIDSRPVDLKIML